MLKSLDLSIAYQKLEFLFFCFWLSLSLSPSLPLSFKVVFLINLHFFVKYISKFFLQSISCIFCTSVKSLTKLST